MELAQALEGKSPDAMLKTLLEHFNCGVGTIHVIEQDGMLHLRAHNAVPAALLAPSRVIPMGKGLAGRVAEQKRALRMSDLLGDTDPRIPIEPKPDEVAAALCVPLFDGTKVVGTLGIAATTGRKFSVDEEEALIAAGRTIAKALAR